MTDPVEATLCMPDGTKSCFGCCPPIRPPGYDHLSHKNIIRRILRENTSAFDGEERGIRPITGFSCWALGYLDRSAAIVGCLLHPLRNRGEDLRYRVDYGDKCRRETCPEAKAFSALGPEERRFWLGLAAGMDSFTYSSPGENPLFHLLGWGPSVLGFIASGRAGRPSRRETFFQEYPFFATSLSPKACAYLLQGVLDRARPRVLGDPLFRAGFERLHEDVCGSLALEAPGEAAETPVHLLGLDPDFANFLRLSLGVKRMGLQEALRLKAGIDGILDTFRKRL